MKTDQLYVGMKVRHPQAGVGVVRSVSEQIAEVRFEDGTRRISPETSELEPAEEYVEVRGLGMPLKQFIEATTGVILDRLGLEQPDEAVEELGVRWNGGKAVLQPGDPALQAKEVPLETFFHKIVMMRNNLRVLEQRINSHEKLTDAEKVEMQQYITRCYGSMTTFNVLFRQKEGQFGAGG